MNIEPHIRPLHAAAFALSLATLASCGRPAAENPECERWTNIYVHGVEHTDTAAIVSLGAYGFGGGIRCRGDEDGQIYLKGRESGKVYRFRGSDDFAPNTEYPFPEESKRLAFTLRFDPIDECDRTLDLVTDTEANLNVDGIRIARPDSLRRQPVCRLSGRLHDMPDTEALLLWPWLEFDGNARGYTAARVIPVADDGSFECEIPAGDRPDYYTLVPWNEYARSAWHSAEFFAEKGDMRISWHAGRQPEISGGRRTEKTAEALKPAYAIYERYAACIESFYETQTDLSDSARALLEQADRETDRARRSKLYAQVNAMPEKERYSPEFHELICRQKEDLRLYTDSIYGVMERDIDPAYLPVLLSDLAMSDYDSRDFLDAERIKSLSAVYAERFADEGTGHRLAEHLAAMRTDVGGTYVDFEAPDREGAMHRFSEMIEGSRIALLDMWASWCGPCRRAAIGNKPIYERYRDKGFAVVSVAREFDDTDALDAAVAKDGYEWPVLVELDDRISLWRTYDAGDSGGLLVLIDPATGRILARNPSAEEIEETVSRYCAHP